MLRRPSLALITAYAMLSAARAEAFVGAVWDYVKQYQFGVDYTSSYDGVRATYETSKASGAAPSDSCSGTGDATQRCTVNLRAGGSSGFGFLLQQAFKKQGLFYFKPDLGLGLRFLSGTTTGNDAVVSESRGLPLRSLKFSLTSLLIKPYVTVGITPDGNWPDFLLSLGPAAQLSVGHVSVNGESESVALATSSGKRLIGGFFELEVVFWRFGDGALSIFTSQDFSGKDGTKFYPHDKDGMSDFSASFARTVSGRFLGLGAKLVLNVP